MKFTSEDGGFMIRYRKDQYPPKKPQEKNPRKKTGWVKGPSPLMY